MSGPSTRATQGPSGPAWGSSIDLALRQMSISFCGISAAGRMKSARPVAMADSGMPSCSASPGLWTRISPPFSLTRAMPTAPSPPVPDSTSAIARSRCPSARLRKKVSMATWAGWLRSSGPTSSMSPSIASCMSGAMT
jgi:hypothetical protein